MDHNPNSGEQANSQTNLDFRIAVNAVHDALQRYRLLLSAEQDKDGAAGHYDRLIDGLANSLSADPATWYSGRDNNPGTFLGELTAEFQASDLVDYIQQRFGQPNLLISAREDFIAAMLKREPVHKTNPDFRDNILGTSIVGTTETHGDKTVTLVPNNEAAVLKIHFTGQTESQTVGFHPPVTITSHGTTDLAASLDVASQGDDFALFGQPCGQACTHTCIDCIAVCGGRLVQRIAPRRVYESKPEAEAVASQHAEVLLDQQFASDTESALKESNNRYASRIRGPLAGWSRLSAQLAICDGRHPTDDSSGRGQQLPNRVAK